MSTPRSDYLTPVVPAKTKVKDLTGQRFGKLLVTGRAGTARKKEATWNCACDCGNKKVVVGYSLTGGKTKSCGKHGSKHRLKDLAGQKFGRLTVLSRAGSNKRNGALWLCACSCEYGRTAVVSSSHLLNGHTTSCHCLQLEKFALLTTRHGQARRFGYSGAYKSWVDMIKRCTNPKHVFWKNYGGRGIVICPAWMNFENFYADMKDRPKGLTLDRTDVDGNYEPGNCEWADRYQQAQNQRLRADSKTGCRGISIVGGKRYCAGITAKGVHYHLGSFPLTPTGFEAAKTARQLAEDIYWGGDR